MERRGQVGFHNIDSSYIYLLDIEETGRMTFQEGKVNTSGLMGTNLWVNLRMDYQAGKECMKPKVVTYLSGI